ncbi:MAG: GH3 family domain-containing protein, partial [Candidatus Bathyarchaeia archaeon]
MMLDEDAINSILQPIIGPWYESLENPQKAQEQVLCELLAKYALTDYGKSHSAPAIKGVTEYQNKFPVIDYKGLMPYFAQVKEGNYNVILPEPPKCWVMTRGSTGHAKVLPATQLHLKQIFTCGARALINYALKRKNFSVFTGDILNLNFPSS